MIITLAGGGDIEFLKRTYVPIILGDPSGKI